MVLEVVARRLPIDRRLVAVRVVAVANNAVVLVVGVSRDPINQRRSVARRRVRDRAS